MSLPDVEKISKLIDAIREYAMRSGRGYREEHLVETYDAPYQASWDALASFELVQDRELVDFLIGGSEESTLLLRNLQTCLQWYGQSEVDEILRHLSMMSIMN